MKKSFKKRQPKRSTRRSTKKSDTKIEETTVVDLAIDINKEPSEFISKASIDQHYNAQSVNREKYQAVLMAFDEYSIEISQSAKARILSAAFARHDHTLINHLLNEHKQFGFTDVLKSLTILDSAREKRAIEKKLARIAKTGSVMKQTKAAKFNVDKKNLALQIPTHGSCSGALSRHIRKWVRSFKESQLEFYALQMPTEPWKKLANLIHLNPVKDFPNAPWFLPYCFGQALESGTKLEKCKNMTAQNVNDLIAEYDLPYSYIKKFSSSLNKESKIKIAKCQDSVDQILWHYEDLVCKEVDDIIRARLENGEEVNMPYGKLMERLLMLKDKSGKNFSDKNSIFSLIIPDAEKRLLTFKSTLPGPVAVIGDASASMSVAIRTATIISSLLTAICSAKLSFFNNKTWDATVDPKKISDVLQLAHSTKASCSTAPAASLVPFYEKKEVVKTIVIVTDEEENTPASFKDKKGKEDRLMFYDLFMKYRKEVYPASLIFISFLRSQHSEGDMYRKFKSSEVPDVMQFKFSGDRPDLTKLDSILGYLCSKTSQSFEAFVENLESDLKTKSVSSELADLQVNDIPVITNDTKGETETLVVRENETPVTTETVKINMI